MFTRFDVIDPCRRWPFATRVKHPVDSLGCPGKHSLDLTTIKIAHPTNQPALTRLLLRPKAKRDALHAPPYQHTNCFAHSTTTTRELRHAKAPAAQRVNLKHQHEIGDSYRFGTTWRQPDF